VGPSLCQGSAEVTSNLSTELCFLALAQPGHASHSEAIKALMGCKQYARILGLSRGYPYILYLSLSKWDAAPVSPFFHRLRFVSARGKNIGATRARHHPDFQCLPEVSLSRCGCGPEFLHPHASISARTEVRRLRSEMGKFCRVSWRRFCTPGPMAT
jgi:hypothetical protein